MMRLTPEMLASTGEGHQEEHQSAEDEARDRARQHRDGVPYPPPRRKPRRSSGAQDAHADRGHGSPAQDHRHAQFHLGLPHMGSPHVANYRRPKGEHAPEHENRGTRCP